MGGGRKIIIQDKEGGKEMAMDLARLHDYKIRRRGTRREHLPLRHLQRLARRAQNTKEVKLWEDYLHVLYVFCNPA